MKNKANTKITEIEFATNLLRYLFGVQLTEKKLVRDVMNERRGRLFFTITMKV